MAQAKGLPGVKCSRADEVLVVENNEKFAVKVLMEEAFGQRPREGVVSPGSMKQFTLHAADARFEIFPAEEAHPFGVMADPQPDSPPESPPESGHELGIEPQAPRHHELSLSDSVEQVDKMGGPSPE